MIYCEHYMDKKKNPRGGPAAVADLIKGLDPDHQTRLLENVAKRNPQLVVQVKELLFTWKDLPSLADTLVQKLLNETPRVSLILALRGASPEIQKKVSSNLSTRAWSALQDEIEAIGPQRKTDVQLARTQICERAHALLKGKPKA